MLEWHAHATNAAAVDTWLRGRFLEEWADPRAVAQLRHVFVHYIARALLASMDLFRWLAQETADSWGYAYPAVAEQKTARIVQELVDPVLS